MTSPYTARTLAETVFAALAMGTLAACADVSAPPSTAAVKVPLPQSLHDLSFLGGTQADPAHYVACAATGHTYEVVSTDAGTWEHAVLAAGSRRLGLVPGHLAVVTSQAENDCIATLVNPNVPSNDVLDQFFIGGHQATVPGGTTSQNWSWVTGEAWSYTNWNNPPEPNDCNSPTCNQPPSPPGAWGIEDGDEQYLTLVLTGLANNGKWNDADDRSRGYIVEYDGLPPKSVGDPFTLLCSIIKGPPLLVSGPGNSANAIADELCDKLARAHDFDVAGDKKQRNNMLNAFINNVGAQSGKKIKTSDANGLILAAQALSVLPAPISFSP